MTALARAARDLVRAGLHVQARPLVDELATMLETTSALEDGAALVSGLGSRNPYEHDAVAELRRRGIIQ